MILLPIELDETKNTRFAGNPECVEVMEVYPGYYKKVGYNKPWIGYFASEDGSEIIGCGGYKGRPKEGKVEIAYGTFKKYEGRGIGTEICWQLVLMAEQTDPTLRIMARTLPENNASCSILRRNGFECLGAVMDEEDGEVWEWREMTGLPTHI